MLTQARARKLYCKLKLEEGYKFDIYRLNELITPKTRLINF